MVHERIRIAALVSASSTRDGLGGEMQRPRLRSITAADALRRACLWGQESRMKVSEFSDDDAASNT